MGLLKEEFVFLPLAEILHLVAETSDRLWELLLQLLAELRNAFFFSFHLFKHWLNRLYFLRLNRLVLLHSNRLYNSHEFLREFHLSSLSLAGQIRSRVFMLHQDLLREVHTGHPQKVRPLSLLPQHQYLLAPIENSKESHIRDQDSLRLLLDQGGKWRTSGTSCQMSKGAYCVQDMQGENGAGNHTETHCYCSSEGGKRLPDCTSAWHQAQSRKQDTVVAFRSSRQLLSHSKKQRRVEGSNGRYFQVLLRRQNAGEVQLL